MTQTAEQERLWWNVATPENLWNGPGMGSEHDELITSRLAKIPEGPVLELGAGDGRVLTRLAELHPERNWVGLDIVARRPGYPMPPNAAFLLGDGRTIPMPDASWAGVYSVLLFQHLPEDAMHGYIQEAFRVLKPGGIFAFQFVAWTDGCGHQDSFLNHRHYPIDVVSSCREAGFQSAWGGQALDTNDWCWITAEKEPA